MAISGKNFDTSIGDLTVHVETATLSIEDASGVGKSKGVPTSRVDGEVGGSGDIVLDISNFNIVSEQAKRAGSWRGLPTFDLLFYANDNRGEEFKVEAFGCALRLESLVNVDSKGGEKSTVTLKYDVTSPDFVRINGVPYLTALETDGLMYISNAVSSLTSFL